MSFGTSFAGNSSDSFSGSSFGTLSTVQLNLEKLRPHQRMSSALNLPYENVNHLFATQTRANPNKTFIFSPGVEEEKFTYFELYKGVVETTHYLTSLGLQQGDRLSVVIPNSPMFLFFYFASLRLGITFVPINPEMASREMLYIIKNSEAKVVLFQAAVVEKMRVLETELASHVRLQQIERYEFLKDSAPKPDSEKWAGQKSSQHDDQQSNPPNDEYVRRFFELDQPPSITLHQEAVIIYTSGTTGNPKGVVLCHMNLLADAKGIHDWFQFSSETRTLCILPLFHNNGQIVTLLAPLYGGGSTVIVQGRASLAAFWGLVDQYQVTFTSVMSAILSILLSLPIERTEARRLAGHPDKSLQGIICGGQVLLPSVQNSFETRFGVPIFEGFGLTETTSFSCFNDFPAGKRRPGSIGKALPINQMEVVDEEGRVLPPGQDGEIVIRGFNVCNEYLSLPEINRKKFHDGWFFSGDYGSKDEEGYFYFKGRRDFLIIKGGENIYPSELENVLYLHDNVAEVAVIGIPCSLLGQDLGAFVKLKDPTRTTKEELKKFCSDKIAKFKQPKEIVFLRDLKEMPELPKGPTKKVLYNVLSKYYTEHVAQV